ncbi:MAG: glycosyltransferase family A protein [Ferruginibacter sp.]
MLKEQEYKGPDVTAVIIAMTDAEQPFVPDAVRSVFSTACIAQVILCIETKNDWVDTTLGKLTTDPRLEIVRLPLAPPGAVRNTALKHVRMSWIAYCDGDDVWRKDKSLQRHYAIATRCDFVGADHYLTDDDGRIRAFALARYMPMLSSWMVRTEVMKQYPFNETMMTAEDGEWWFRTESKIRKVRYSKMLLEYRVRSSSLSSVTPSKRRKAQIVALASKPVIGIFVYLFTGCLWLLTRKKEYMWHKGWAKRPG